jgi:ATP-binding cassette, subfamily A (ABC1), member 3
MIISSVGYLVLAWLVTKFFPGKFGTPVNIMDSFSWNAKKQSITEENVAFPLTDEGNRKFERVDNDQTPVLSILNLCKDLRPSLLQTPRTVIRDLSLNIYKNQITVLLGPRGAGKTTTISMLTGMVAPTAGTIILDGISSVSSYRNQIRSISQHNSFIPHLTCMEHLLFFGQLRGLPLVEARKQAIHIFDEIHLTDKSDTRPHTLSIGMQIRMSLANALIGGTKLLALDEPSSGLDPESRCELWNVLLRLKKSTSILVATHCTEEAEVLGDKIAVMENGEVVAYGSSSFLKLMYGNGYTLKLLKKDKNTFPRDTVLDLICKAIPGAKSKSDVDSMMWVLLPYEYQQDYATILKQLEERQEEFGIETIGITNTTMQECLKLVLI